jgi:hypothetical protein
VAKRSSCEQRPRRQCIREASVRCIAMLSRKGRGFQLCQPPGFGADLDWLVSATKRFHPTIPSLNLPCRSQHLHPTLSAQPARIGCRCACKPQLHGMGSLLRQPALCGAEDAPHPAALAHLDAEVPSHLTSTDARLRKTSWRSVSSKEITTCTA